MGFVEVEVEDGGGLALQRVLQFGEQDQQGIRGVKHAAQEPRPLAAGERWPDRSRLVRIENGCPAGGTDIRGDKERAGHCDSLPKAIGCID